MASGVTSWEGDLGYPLKLLKAHNAYPLAPEKATVP